MQRVEEKVRLQLRGEGLESGLGETRLELRGLGDMTDSPTVELDRVDDGHHRAERHDFADEAADEDASEYDGAIIRNRSLDDGDVQEVLDGNACDDHERLEGRRAHAPSAFPRHGADEPEEHR